MVTRSRHRTHAALLLTACLAVLVSLVCAPQADAASLWDLFKPRPPVAAPIPPVAAPVAADPPAGAAVGTMIMVPGTGWAGHHAPGQELLMSRPGDLLRSRGWRVVSIDYEEGAAGLQNVLSAVGDELVRKTSAGPLCIYGESSGAQLALVAASQLRSIDCVAGVATPTDLALYTAEARSAVDTKVSRLAGRISEFFGATPEEMAAWNPVVLSPAIQADVMLLHELDDPLIAPSQAARFQSVHPTATVVPLEAGDPADTAARFAHGTVSEIGRARYAAAVGAFADRAVAAADAQRSAARTGCKQVGEPVAKIGPRGLLSALRCLARKGARPPAAESRTWQRTIVNMHGEVTAARLWTQLLATRSGRRALAASAARRARIGVRTGAPSRVTLRARR